MTITPICEIQGDGLWSPLAGKTVTTQGVVTGMVRQGFFIQSVVSSENFATSDGVFVYSPDWLPPVDALLEVTGEVLDYIKDEQSKPVTQIKFDQVKPIERQGPAIEPFILTAKNLPSDTHEQAVFLNCIEGMLVGIEAGNSFIAPSNPFGDYVLMLNSDDIVTTGLVRSQDGGVLLEHSNPQRWFPGFRLRDFVNAPRINVGSTLESTITGPLHYRVEAYQIAATSTFEYSQNEIKLVRSSLKPSAHSLTIMTLNCFNLDVCIESEDKVMNPRQDVDDDWGDGRFHSLAKAIVLQANCPDIIALQEIQDNDGAEISDVVSASHTYIALTKTIAQYCDIDYEWVEIAPEVGADGGQPGGNIRNAFLFNPKRVECIKETVAIFAQTEECFVDSRKPLIAHFKEKASGKVLACINLHLASKRHQNSIFSPNEPGVDGKLAIRVQQAEKVNEKLHELDTNKIDYYVTGDFNDTQESETLEVFSNSCVNLVNSLPETERYDYNHRGKLQVLMHGLVSKDLAQLNPEYEIIHGNELIGVVPGQESNKPSDHAYVLAKLVLDDKK